MFFFGIMIQGVVWPVSSCWGPHLRFVGFVLYSYPKQTLNKNTEQTRFMKCFTVVLLVFLNSHHFMLCAKEKTLGNHPEHDPKGKAISKANWAGS